MSRQYFAFTDPSGGAQDSFPMAISACSLFNDEKFVIVALMERKPPFNPEDVVREYVEMLRSYHLSEVVGDRYAGAWVSSSFAKCGITYTPSELSKSEIYQQFVMLLNARKVRLPLNRRLRAQLLSLERRTRSGGRDIVDHRPGQHDDLANCVAGALVLAASEQEESVPWVEFVSLNPADAPAKPLPTDWATRAPVDEERLWKKLY